MPHQAWEESRLRSATAGDNGWQHHSSEPVVAWLRLPWPAEHQGLQAEMLLGAAASSCCVPSIAWHRSLLLSSSPMWSSHSGYAGCPACCLPCSQASHPDRTGGSHTWQSSAQLQPPGRPPASAGAAPAPPGVLLSRRSQESAGPRPPPQPHQVLYRRLLINFGRCALL